MLRRFGPGWISSQKQISGRALTSAVFGLVIVAWHAAIGLAGADSPSGQRVATEAGFMSEITQKATKQNIPLTSIFHSCIGISLTSLKTASDGVVGIRLHTESAALGALGIATNTGETQSAWVDIGARRVCRIAIPTGNVAEQ